MVHKLLTAVPCISEYSTVSTGFGKSGIPSFLTLFTPIVSVLYIVCLRIHTRLSLHKTHFVLALCRLLIFCLNETQAKVKMGYWWDKLSPPQLSEKLALKVFSLLLPFILFSCSITPITVGHTSCPRMSLKTRACS